jgi:hypothetical protein
MEEKSLHMKVQASFQHNNTKLEQSHMTFKGLVIEWLGTL